MDLKEALQTQFGITEVAFVIAGKSSPPLLNAEFLRVNGIVDPDDEPAEGKAYTTPLVSRVEYPNGLSFQMDHEKLIFIKKFKNPSEAWDSDIGSIAERLVEAAPIASIEALGINPRGLVPFMDMAPDRSVVRDDLIRNIEWADLGGDPPFCKLEMSFDRNDHVVLIKLEDVQAELRNKEGRFPAVIVECNVHRTAPPKGSAKEVRAFARQAVANWKNDVATCVRIVQKVLRLEEATSNE